MHHWHDHCCVFLSPTPWRIHKQCVRHDPLFPQRCTIIRGGPKHKYTYLHRCRTPYSHICLTHFYGPEKWCMRWSNRPWPLRRPLPLLCQSLCLPSCSPPRSQRTCHHPLATAYIIQTLHKIQPKHITKALKDCVTFLGADLGFLATDVTARCLRASGANALLLAKVDTDIIWLFRRWRSDELLWYLHVQAAPLMSDYARCMLQAGHYTLIPNQLVPLH